MSMRSSPITAAQRWFLPVFAIVVLLGDGFLMRTALLDRSWTSFGIALIYGPLANLLAAVAGFLLVFRIYPNESDRDWPCVIVLLIPIVLGVTLSVLVFRLDLHGG
jgi:hypothetical protein